MLFLYFFGITYHMSTTMNMYVYIYILHHACTKKFQDCMKTITYHSIIWGGSINGDIPNNMVYRFVDTNILGKRPYHNIGVFTSMLKISFPWISMSKMDFGLAIIDEIARALEIHKCPRRKYLESSDIQCSRTMTEEQMNQT